MRRVIITGGAGFIGSNFVRLALARKSDWQLTTLDCLTYAGNLENLAGLESHPRHRFEKLDITDAPELERVFAEKPDGVIANNTTNKSTGCCVGFHFLFSGCRLIVEELALLRTAGVAGVATGGFRLSNSAATEVASCSRSASVK